MVYALLHTFQDVQYVGRWFLWFQGRLSCENFIENSFYIRSRLEK